MRFELWFVRGVYLGMTSRERKADSSRLSCVMSCEFNKERVWGWLFERGRPYQN